MYTELKDVFDLHDKIGPKEIDFLDKIEAHNNEVERLTQILLDAVNNFRPIRTHLHESIDQDKKSVISDALTNLAKNNKDN